VYVLYERERLIGAKNKPERVKFARSSRFADGSTRAVLAKRKTRRSPVFKTVSNTNGSYRPVNFKLHVRAFYPNFSINFRFLNNDTTYTPVERILERTSVYYRLRAQHCRFYTYVHVPKFKLIRKNGGIVVPRRMTFVRRDKKDSFVVFRFRQSPTLPRIAPQIRAFRGYKSHTRNRDISESPRVCVNMVIAAC